MYRLKLECKFFVSSKGIVELTIKFLKFQLEKTFNEEKKEKIEQMIEKRKMLNIIKDYKNDFDSDEINSIDYRNQTSISGYTTARI
ncbi:hypothetical protein [Spiroplasma endosymbiont of Colias croceus]|uniref:hypothetical protein n=1 Tax=Spiroplasma endosymbiont of Colias croceus TaxID=3066310 RepID=UPI0030D48AFD